MLLTDATLAWDQGAGRKSDLKKAETRKKKHFLQSQRLEAYSLSPSAQDLAGPEGQAGSGKAVLHSISLAVTKVGTGPPPRVTPPWLPPRLPRCSLGCRRWRVSLTKLLSAPNSKTTHPNGGDVLSQLREEEGGSLGTDLQTPGVWGPCGCGTNGPLRRPRPRWTGFCKGAISGPL